MTFTALTFDGMKGGRGKRSRKNRPPAGGEPTMVETKRGARCVRVKKNGLWEFLPGSACAGGSEVSEFSGRKGKRS